MEVLIEKIDSYKIVDVSNLKFYNKTDETLLNNILSCINEIKEFKRHITKEDMVDIAIEKGYLDVVMYFHQIENYKISSYMLGLAVEHNKMNVAVYLSKFLDPKNPKIIYRIIDKNIPEDIIFNNVSWLIQQGYKYDKDALDYARNIGYKRVVELLLNSSN
jgi:hypothetical protein